jgi:hypothetical protein
MPAGGRAGFSDRAPWQGSLRPILVISHLTRNRRPGAAEGREGSASVASRLQTGHRGAMCGASPDLLASAA